MHTREHIHTCAHTRTHTTHTGLCLIEKKLPAPCPLPFFLVYFSSPLLGVAERSSSSRFEILLSCSPTGIKSYSFGATKPRSQPCSSPQSKPICLCKASSNLQVCNCVPRSLSPAGTQPGPGMGSLPLGAGSDFCPQSQAAVTELKG